MARTSIKVKAERRKQALERSLAAGKKPVKATRVYNRCRVCGKVGAYMRRFEMCRICFRQLASQGKIMGVKKSSW